MPSHDAGTTVIVNKPFEFALSAQQSYGDIFNEIEVDVVVTDSSGETWRVPAFWAGDTVFRVRFAAPRPGAYTWRSVCTDPNDAGLHGRTGAFTAIPYEGSSTLYQHGRLRVAPSNRTLEHADGTLFLWLADTWWMGLTKRLDWPDGFRRLTEDRVRKGFNTIQIVAGPLPDFCATRATWDPQQANEAGWPWESGFARINPAFYDLADLRIALMIEQGLMPCIVGMWGYYLSFMGVDRCKQHWRNLVARYGAYPVTWCLAGEATMPTYAHHGTPEGERDRETQKDGWTEVARYLREIDPWHNLVTVHPSGMASSRDSLAETSLVDFDMLQTGHSGYYSLAPSMEDIKKAVAEQPRIPAFNSEACYEGIMGGSKDEIQRFLFWSNMLQGACGHTYGAQGIWAMSSRDEPFEGTTHSWGDGVWQDVMHLPGSTHVGVGAEILRRYPWWRLAPSAEPAAVAAGRAYSHTARIPDQLILVYLPCNCFPPEMLGNQSNGGVPLQLRIEDGAHYQAAYHNPRSGEEIPIGDVLPEDGAWVPPRKPTMEDWVLVLQS
jgi:hypothetical protein